MRARPFLTASPAFHHRGHTPVPGQSSPDRPRTLRPTRTPNQPGRTSAARKPAGVALTPIGLPRTPSPESGTPRLPALLAGQAPHSHTMPLHGAGSGGPPRPMGSTQRKRFLKPPTQTPSQLRRAGQRPAPQVPATSRRRTVL